jgi:shikimate kinase
LLLATDITLEERLHKLLEARVKVYQQAHFIIETDGRSEDEVVQRVMVQVSEVMRGGDMTLE